MACTTVRLSAARQRPRERVATHQLVQLGLAERRQVRDFLALAQRIAGKGQRPPRFLDAEGIRGGAQGTLDAGIGHREDEIVQRR